jgi:hypothetical protein
MSVVRHIITAFSAGEISPMLMGRTDTQQYAFGLETCENFFPSDEGPIIKRPGFEFIRAADASATWISAFRFSITQEYMLEWSEEKLRFYTNGGRIETDGTPYEITTPYTAAHAPYLSHQQSYDKLYVDHGSYPPGSIKRTAATTFAYSVSEFTDGPFTDQNTDKAITVQTSAATGEVELTATADIFLAGHVGSLFKLEAYDFSSMNAWEPGIKDIAIGKQVRSDGKIYMLIEGNATGTIQPTHNEGAEWDGMGLKDMLNDKGPYGAKWQFMSERFGTVKITEVVDARTAIGTVIKRLPDSLITVPSWRWSHGAFSVARGYPSLVRHWKGRQIHFKGFEMLASVVGDYLNHSTFTSSGIVEADLAFRRTMSIENPPLWVAADRSLIVGTANTEIAVGPVNSQAALSGSNIEAEPQSYYGSEAVPSISAGTTTIFVERGGRRIRATDFAFAKDRYEPIDLTAAARHITTGGVIQLAYQRTPYAMVHGVRGDGQIITHTFTRGDIKGWSRLKLGGDAKALSAVSIVGEDGKTDELWVLVSRQTPAGEQREIWKQTAWRELGDEQRNAFYVDGGASTTASAGQTHFSGLSHLAGQAVVVLADGQVIQDLTVAEDGTLDLPAYNVPDHDYVMTVGLSYTATAVTLRPEPAGAQGSIQGLRQRVVQLVLRVLETFGIKAGAPDNDLVELQDRPASANMDEPAPLYTGDTDSAGVDCEFNRNGQIRFVSDLPLPAIITSAMMKLDVDGRDG